MILHKIILNICVIFFLVRVTHAQQTIKAVKIETPPELDGKVNEEVWEHAYIIDEFYQQEPNFDSLVSERTEIYTCYDSKNVYFAAKCWDDPEKISAKEMLRDANLNNDDRIRILIDTYLNKRTGFSFSINPRGSKNDALISDDGATKNEDWNGIWIGKARITDYGWEAEIAIPFSTLGFKEGNDKWGVKFCREIKHKIESSYWPRVNINSRPNQISDSGILNGLNGISQGIGLDISPFLLSGLDHSKREGSKYKLSVGLDVSYQITPSLKTSISINTDFAETEVDNRQINLTRFSLHYPEKRNFFLDGASYFQFGNESGGNKSVSERVITFFSRRMGLDTIGQPVPINYAAKFTGIVNNWNIGIMYINDDREKGKNNFYVSRISRNIWEQSSIGIIGTYGNTMGSETNLVTGLDLKLRTSTFKGNKNATMILYGLKSFTENISDTDNGSYGLQFAYPNDLIDASVGYYQVGENFVAGMGFVPRSNIRESFGALTFSPRLNKYGILQVSFGGNFSTIYNLKTGELETRKIKIQPIGFRFLSGDEITYSINNQYELLQKDFNIFEDIIILEGEYSWWQHEIKLDSKGARDVWGELTYGFGQFYNGKRKNIELEANWKIGAPLLLTGILNRNIIDLPDGSFTANVYQFNANILFSPNLTLYNYIQYDNASNNIGWQSRFRWILKPGNEILLVWNSRFLESEQNYIMDTSSLRFKIKYNIRF